MDLSEHLCDIDKRCVMSHNIALQVVRIATSVGRVCIIV